MKMPLMLDVKGKGVLVVGGGTIGLRKTKTFLKYGANVTCLSLDFLEDFQEMELTCIQGGYPIKLDAYDIIIAATNDESLNGRIYEDAKALHKLCMTVDHINPSDFDFMAIRAKHDLTIAVSTGGKSPLFSKQIVDALMEFVSDEDLEKLERMVRKRQRRFQKTL